MLVNGSPTERPSLHIGNACRVLVKEMPEVIVLCSPHGSSTGVYESAAGHLGPQGIPQISAPRDPSELAKVLADEWERPVLSDMADHGIVVPQVLGAIPEGAEVVACCLEEWTGQTQRSAQEAIEEASVLADAVRTAFGDREVAFVASAHGSAALSPRAPLTERPEGIELEKRLHAALLDDVSQLTAMGAREWEGAGCCGAGPLTALALLVSGPAELLAYDAPFGVGYLAARWAQRR